MQTEHALRVGDSSSTDLADESVDLVVTSPPYPMIEMWDDAFAAMDDDVADALDAGDGQRAFEAMHARLDAVWDEVARVLRPGGVACVNVGDATRTVDGDFQQYPNHSRVIDAFRERGLRSLPDVLWRKPTNSGTKFMGSGTLPTNAYVTLEHEYVLVFRKGGPREFDPGARRRYESAFFWEERNEWFSDVWTFTGTDQSLPADLRDRAAAFPLTLPLRLIRMYSVYGDTVWDPFVGTGTTTLAAMLAGRNSVGHDVDADLLSAFDERIEGLPARSRQEVAERLADHRAFMVDRADDYPAEHYDFDVVTERERRIRLYAVSDVERVDADDDVDDADVDTDDHRSYRLEHDSVDGAEARALASDVDVGGDGAAQTGTADE